MWKCRCRQVVRKSKPTPVPLNGVSMNVSINQDIASVSLRQVFFNDSDDNIEVDYTFPIPSDAALSSLRILSGGKIIEGVVKDKEKAREEYDDAISRGDCPYMVEVESKKNSVTLHVGNILPHVEVIVEVSYVLEVKFEKNGWRLVIPKNSIIGGSSNTKRTEESWLFECNILTSSALKDVQLNFEHKTEHLSNYSAKFTSTEARIPEKDIDMFYTIEDFTAPFSLLQRDPRTGATGLHFSFQPIFSSGRLEDYDPSGEFILLLDRSGSMSGKQIAKAKEAAELFIKSLPQKSLFNLISFGSTYVKIFYESVAYTSENITAALSKIRDFEADLGGTELYAPLYNILESQPNASYPRYIFVITDGEVSDKDRIVHMVGRNHRNTRVSTLGIGHGADRELIKDVAKAGLGSHRILLLSEGLTQGVLKSLEEAIQPTLNDISIEWLSGEPRVQSPPVPFYAFNGDRVSFNAVLEDLDSPVKYRVRFTDSLTDVRNTLEFISDLSSLVEGREAIVQAVRGAFGTEDEVSLAVKYQVLSEKTSLIAVERLSTVIENPTRLVSIEVQPNYGRSGSKKKRGRAVLFGGPSSPESRSRGRTRGKVGGLPMVGGLREVEEFMLEGGLAKEGNRMRFNSRSASPVSPMNSPSDHEEFRRCRNRMIARSRSISREAINTSCSQVFGLQNTDGSWSLTPAIKAFVNEICGFTLENALAEFPETSADVVTTAIVIAILQEKFAHEADISRLIVAKAKRYIKKLGEFTIILSQIQA